VEKSDKPPVFEKSGKPPVLGPHNFSWFVASSSGPALMTRGCFGALRLAAARPKCDDTSTKDGFVDLRSDALEGRDNPVGGDGKGKRTSSISMPSAWPAP